MEVYSQLLNEVMQVAVHQGWGQAMEGQDVALAGGTHANFYEHRATCVLHGVAFRGTGTASKQKEAKKRAHREIAFQLLPGIAPQGASDQVMASAMRQAFNEAKGSKSLRQLLERGLQERRLAGDAACPEATETKASQLAPYAPGVSHYGAPTSPYGPPTSGPAPQPSPYAPEPTPYAAQPMPYTAQRSPYAAPRPYGSQPGPYQAQPPPSPYGPQPGTYALPAASAHGPQPASQVAPVPHAGPTSLAGPVAQIASPYSVDAYSLGAPVPPRPVATRPVAVPAPRLSMAELEHRSMSGVTLRRTHPEVLLCVILRALGGRWEAKMPATFGYGHSDEALPTSIDLGYPPMATVSLKERDISAVRVSPDPTTGNASLDAGPQPVSIRVFDSLLQDAWSMRMPDSQGRIVSSVLLRGQKEPSIESKDAGADDAGLILALSNWQWEAVQDMWHALMAAVQKLPGYVGDATLPGTMPNIDPVVPHPPMRASSSTQQAGDELLAHLRERALCRLPSAAQLLHRVARRHAHRADALAAIHAATPKLSGAVGELRYRGVCLEAGDPALCAAGLELTELALKRKTPPLTRSVVAWGSVVESLCRTLDYLLGIGSLRDLASFQALLLRYLEHSDEENAAQATGRESTLRPRMARLQARQRRLGDLWTDAEVYPRLRDALQLHAACVAQPAALPSELGGAGGAASSQGCGALEPVRLHPVLHDILSDQGGVGEVLNEGHPVTYRGHLLQILCASPLFPNALHAPRSGSNAILDSEAATPRRIVSRLIAERLLPAGKILVHRCVSSPMAYVFHAGEHHINVVNRWVFSFLACLPPHRAPAAKFFQAVLRATADAPADEAMDVTSAAASTSNTTEEDTPQVAGDLRNGQERREIDRPVMPLVPPVVTSGAASGFATALEASLRCLLAGLVYRADGDVCVDPLLDERDAFALRSVSTRAVLARLIFDTADSSFFLVTREDPWAAKQGGTFCHAAAEGLLRQHAVREILWYQAKSSPDGGSMVAKSRVYLGGGANGLGGGLGLESHGSFALPSPKKGDGGGNDDDMDALSDTETGETADDRTASRSRRGGPCVRARDRLLLRFFASSGSERLDHIVHLECFHLALVRRMLEPMLTGTAPEKTFLYDGSRLASDADGFPAGRATLLLGDAYRGKVFFRGMLVGTGNFPWAGLNYCAPEPRPAWQVGQTENVRSVVDEDSLLDVWDALLRDPSFHCQDFFERLSHKYHNSTEARRNELLVVANGETLLHAHLGPTLRHPLLRSMLVQRAREGFENSGASAALIDEIEKWVWDLMPPFKEGQPVLVHPLVHSLLTFHGHSLHVQLTRTLVERSPLVVGSLALPPRGLSGLERAMRTLGIAGDQDEFVFHDTPYRPLLYAKAGRRHHLAARFTGRELLTQMLLSVEEGDQIRVLERLQARSGPWSGEAKASPDKTVDALVFLMELEASTFSAEPELIEQTKAVVKERQLSQKRLREEEAVDRFVG